MKKSTRWSQQHETLQTQRLVANTVVTYKCTSWLFDKGKPADIGIKTI